MPRSATRSRTLSTGASSRTANSRATGASCSSSTPSHRGQPLARVGGPLDQQLAELAEALAAEPGEVDHRPERVQRLGGADVVGRFLAADVLLAGLQREDEAAAAVDVLGLAGDPPRHAADLRLGRAEEAEGRAAEVESVAQRLPLAEGDVGAALARRLQDPQRHRVAGDDQQRPVLLRRRAERLDVLDRAEEVRALEDDRGGLAVDRRGQRRGVGQPALEPDLDHLGAVADRVGRAASRGCAGGRRGRRRTCGAWSRPSPGSRPRRPRRAPRRGRRWRPAARSAPTSPSGTRTSPAARPGRSPAGRACTA